MSRKTHRGKAKARTPRRRRTLYRRAAYLGLVALLFGALVTLFGLGGTDERPVALANAGGTLSVSDDFHDFGRVSMGAGTVRHTFRLRNDGAEPAAIRRVYTSCMCTEATLVQGGERVGPFGMPGHGYDTDVGRTVAPGESVTVEAVFDPNAHGPAGIGRNDRVVSVLTGNGAGVELRFTAYVTP